MNDQRVSPCELTPSASFDNDGFDSRDVHYRGCRIVWDVRRAPGMLFWTGKVAVVLPVDGVDVERVHRVHSSDYFFSEEDARDHLISAAKRWIDIRDETGSSCEH